MAGKRLVLFDIGGVLVTPGPPATIQRLEEALRLPSGFIRDVFVKSALNGAFRLAERGEIPYSQFITEMNKECKESAEKSGVALPESFSVEPAFNSVIDVNNINKPMLKAAKTLRHHGFKTGVLTNNWVDDGPNRHRSALFFSFLRQHFDAVIESCRVGMRKPDPRIYQYALKMMQTEPSKTIFLDDLGPNLKSARELGISTVLVRDTNKALKELEDLSGVQLLDKEEIPPPAAHPDAVPHGFVTIKPGVKLHYVEMGSGPVICLCHGFPESWYSWRYQLPALAEAGYRVIALDMKGFGDSSAPHAIEEYSQEELCKDLVIFLDKLGISQATLIGHDWGGFLVWNMALFYPERVRAVASLNTPFFEIDPEIRTSERVKANPLFDYQIYFQEQGVAEAELENNLERTFKIFFRGTGETEGVRYLVVNQAELATGYFQLYHLLFPLIENTAKGKAGVPDNDELKSLERVTSLSTSSVQERGGLFVGIPEEVPRSKILSEFDLQYYVTQFKKSGFRGPLNWYRNMDRTWEWTKIAHKWKIQVPSLMVTAGKDPVLLPVMTTGMENRIPNLTRAHIEECGHWTQMERPAALNEILIKWLGEVHTPLVPSKL
ncbi:bifunctional epoxide hydrolase 2 [Gastrophryne carolinensis]